MVPMMLLFSLSLVYKQHIKRANCRGKYGAVLGGFNANDLIHQLETIPD